MSAAIVFGVYTLQFPYLDSAKAKLRPAIVVSEPQGKHNVIAIVPISSRPGHAAVDVTLSHWQEAGLARPSVARVHRLTTVLQSDLQTRLGSLQAEDTDVLRTALRTLLSL